MTVALRDESRPYVYEVEPTNACPYRCYMCPRGRGQMKRPVGFMDMDVFKRVLAGVPHGQRILRLHHFGEPVLHPDIGAFVQLARRSGLIPLLSLNPASLTANMTDVLIESGIGIVCFSLDSLDSSKLNRIRGVTKTVDYCREMIDYFVSRSRHARRHVLKIMQMVSLSANREEQGSFLSLKAQYPDGDVHVYISQNYGFGDSGIVAETDESGARALSGGIFRCTAPFDEVVVLWNGDVVLCCYDYDGFNVIGNIAAQSIEEIWQGGRAAGIREAFSKKETGNMQLCGSCYLAPHNVPETAGVIFRKGYAEEQYILDLYPPLLREAHAGR